MRPSLAVLGHRFRIPPFFAQGGSLLDELAVRTAQQQCVTNPIAKHVIVGSDLEALQLAPVMLQVLTVSRLGVTLDDVHQTPAQGLAVPLGNFLGAH